MLSVDSDHTKVEKYVSLLVVDTSWAVLGGVEEVSCYSKSNLWAPQHQSANLNLVKLHPTESGNMEEHMQLNV